MMHKQNVEIAGRVYVTRSQDADFALSCLPFSEELRPITIKRLYFTSRWDFFARSLHLKL